MSRFIVYTGGHAVAYAPTFTSRAEAEAWVNRIGEDGGWEERVEIFEEDAPEFGRRTRLTPTRAGLVSETYFVCYDCSDELEEADTASHAC